MNDHQNLRHPSRRFLPWAIALGLLPGTLIAEVRTWTSTDGKEIQAEYVSATEKAVKVKMSGRGEFDIPLTRLSEEDQKWVAAKLSEPKPIEGEYAALIADDWALSAHGDLPFAFFGSTTFSADKKYPLVVSLHGKSQNNENGKQIGFARKFVNSDNYDTRPCFVLAPLCYQPFGGTGGGWRDKPGTEVLELVEKMAESLPIDRERIYVIGYSMGGFGVCHLMSEEPDLFAAGVAIAGYGYGDHAEKLRKEPLWLLHAADDPVVEIEGSRQFSEELKRSKVFKYTEFETGGHGIAGQVTDDPDVHRWLFEQRNE